MDPQLRAKRQNQKRAEILDAARKLVVRDGLDQVSLRAVAKAAKFAPASLYEYFESKGDIFDALALRAERRLYEAMSQVPKDRKTPHLVRICSAYVGFAKDAPEDFLLLFSRQTSRRQSLDDNLPPGSIFALLVNAVSLAIPPDVKKTKRWTEETSYLFWATAHGMAMLQLTHLTHFKAAFSRVDKEGFTALFNGLGLQCV
ncbi:MAG: TetR/AcrR family transcriptional regulator [Deltaproteobacteria bacterium]|jgi:AcrR family transcriptional regulator|nr:TetR/AcrR family transcriptional regulator [Deltaproteobacteria bacterium]MBT6435314.1 TetR/AcrR family transcriptional regulator [Deltaproteobacteria bacterium]MBT6488161.1 TetR/AcrR family transcriptional regulator [Deltaproteobacteria bacterium]